MPIRRWPTRATARGARSTALRRLADVATGGLQPDRTLLFDCPSRQGLDRAPGGPAADLTRFETADEHDVDFHRRVREGYLALAAASPSAGASSTLCRADVAAPWDAVICCRQAWPDGHRRPVALAG
jgi:thymidylate kinase